MPSGYTSLVKDIKASGFDGSDSCVTAGFFVFIELNLIEFETLMNKYKFPAQIKE